VKGGAHEARFLQESERSVNVRPDELFRTQNGPIDMALCCEVNNCRGPFCCQYRPNCRLIVDVGLYERILWVSLETRQVREVSRVRQFVQVDDTGTAR
jgi:hypothetical protein